MPTKVSGIFRKITRNNKINIGLQICHERFENNYKFLKNVNFYAWQGPQANLRTWNNKVSIPPPNYHIIPFGTIPPYIEYDVLISNSPDVHYPICKQIADSLDIPIVCLWHTFPSINYPRIQLRRVKDIFSQYINCFITEENREAWGFANHDRSFVIKHAVDSDFWKPSDVERKQVILSVANDYANRNHLLGFDLWTKIIGMGTNQQLPCRLVGDTPGFSRSANSVEELREIYRESSIFLSTHLLSPLPMSILEAMACELCVISTNRGMIPSIIEHGKNGLLADPSPQHLRQLCIEMLQNPSACREMGREARKTVQNLFSTSDFITNWEKVLRLAIE